MARGEIQGVAPQNAAVTAPGVSLKQTERAFLDALTDLLSHIGEPGYPKSASAAPPEPPPKPLFTVTFPTITDDPFGLVVPDSYLDSYQKKKRRPHVPVPRTPPKLSDLYRLGEECGLREIDVRYIREWVVDHGIHWLTCTNAEIDDDMEGKRVFRNPVVRRILNAAAESGICVGTTATKEELADFYTQRIRCPHLADSVRDNAADKLAKLLGYYPDATAKGGGTANVQINFVNPYATAPVVEAEVLGDAANA